MREQGTEIVVPLIDNLHLMHLHNCAVSSRMGMVDQGFPRYMKKLQGLGFVKDVNNGYQVTKEGLAYLHLYKELVAKL